MSYFSIKRLVIALTFTVTVLVLTHIPQETIPSKLQVGGLDKIGHVLAYGVITFLFILSLRTSPRLLSASLLFFVILAIGAIDELTQPLVHRTASLTDWLANVMGIVIMVLLYFVCFNNSKRQAPVNVDTRFLKSER